MQCNRLLKLTKSWYLNVVDETMAPARMVAFMEQHIASCDICQNDPDLQKELAKITEIVLPESKIPKAVRMQQAQDDEEEADDIENDENENGDIEDEEDEDDEI